ncbi:hypothetical protein QFC19_004733 [Naganishia cerealis]|uniref:Uncharacterized protein n=1 Tax=Naganishia cerealis TaxID=610337 RepID=A0ACC2VT83_9TREE|nr:hypothetical protein QFC19_004733 [Naganishia cerealis]
MSETLGDCCISGVTWEGTPEGQVRKINGHDVYVGEPKQGGDKSKALLFLSDVFGLGLINNKLMVDDFARQGYYTYLVDYLSGDPIAPEAMNSGNFDFPAWLANHGEEAVHAVLDPVMDGLKEEGVTKFAAVGYCFGVSAFSLLSELLVAEFPSGNYFSVAQGKYAVRLAIQKRISIGMIAHPSLLKIPEDLEALKKVTPEIPMLFVTCTTDFMYGPEQQKVGDDVLGNGTAEGEGYKRVFYEGCSHGFAVRGDKSDPKVKFGKEDAFKQTVNWYVPGSLIAFRGTR